MYVLQFSTLLRLILRLHVFPLLSLQIHLISVTLIIYLFWHLVVSRSLPPLSFFLYRSIYLSFFSLCRFALRTFFDRIQFFASSISSPVVCKFVYKLRPLLSSVFFRDSRTTCTVSMLFLPEFLL